MKHKRLIILLVISVGLFGLVFFLKTNGGATNFVWKISGEGRQLFPLVSISALIDSINPCAFSILLLTIAFLFSLGTLRSGILKIGGMYILGIFVAYLLIGLGILQALHIFNIPHFMGKLGAALLVLMGLIDILNDLFPSFPIKLQIPHAAHGKIAELMRKSSLPAVFLLGAFVGLCEFPCTGGPYLMVLGLLHDQQTYIRGFWYLLWYNLIFVLPLVVVLFIASDNAVLEKVQTWRKQNIGKMRFISGLVMIALGLLIFLL